MNTVKIMQAVRPLARSGHRLSRCLSVPPTTRGFYSRNPISSKFAPVLRHDIWTNDPVSDIWSEMDRMERQMNRLVERSFGRDWMLPSTAWSRQPRLAQSTSDYLPIEVNEDGSRMYRQHYAVTGIEPENVKVTIEDKTITIKARGESESNGSKSIREHTLSYTLPDEVDPEKVRTYLADGYLTIEAPLPPVEPRRQVHELEIERKPAGQIGDQKQVGSN